MKSRIWSLAGISLLFLSLLVVSARAQETDTLRQAPPDTVQQMPEDTLRQEDAEMQEEILRQEETEMQEDPGEQTPEQMGQTTPGETDAQMMQGPTRPAVTGITAYTIDLTGDAAVPGPGAEGSGSAFLVVSPNRGSVCYALDLEGITQPTSASLHEGRAGMSGDSVVNFDIETGGLDACVTNVDASVLTSIMRNPSNFYVNVSNDEFPEGALRGQMLTDEPRGS